MATYLEAIEELLSPILTVILLQLLSYNVAVRHELDVDKLRNLPKSVMVEQLKKPTKLLTKLSKTKIKYSLIKLCKQI
jgi:hypothetical protein